MKIFQNVRGSQSEQPKILEVNVDTVYVRSNIIRIETDDFIGWQYDEMQYQKDEYIESVGIENASLKGENIILNERVTSTENTLLDLLLIGGDL